MVAILLALASANTGCGTLAPPKQTQSQIITTHRTNIATSTQLSSVATTILLSSGLTQDECMNEFHECLERIKDVLIINSATDNEQVIKPTLALLSELYYAKALSLDKQDDCKPIRPPLNPNYTNAPLSAAEYDTQTTRHHACLSAKRNAIKNSINHSYGYLFYDSLTGTDTATSLVNENDIKAQDLYHIASNTLISEIYKQNNSIFINTEQQDTHHLGNNYRQSLVSRHQTDDVTVNLYLTSDPIYSIETDNIEHHLLSDLISAYDPRLADLDVTSARSGLGVPYVGVLSNRQTITTKSSNQNLFSQEKNTLVNTNSNSPSSRIHPMGHILLTGVVKPQGSNLNDVLSTNVLDVHFFNPYTTKEISIAGKRYPLAANYSSGYALWLSENQLQRVSLLSMLNKNTSSPPQLFMLKPYDPNQKIIIMIHGLGSSPATWVNLTNNLFADPILRENYQVWQIFYATNLPMLENRHQIQQLINAAYQMVDPQGIHPASHHSVIIGHSMGGIIARMLVSDDNLLPHLEDLDNLKLDELPTTTNNLNSSHDANSITYLDNLSHASNSNNLDDLSPNKQLNKQLLKELLNKPYHDDFQNRFMLTALPQVDTAIFISAPFAGTDYAERWFTRFARRVVRLPLDITKTAASIITDGGRIDENQLQNSFIGSLYLQNGPSQLSDRSEFVKLTKNLTINSKVTYHTIMGDSSGNAENLQGSLVGRNLSDGVVPYDSSHLDGAASETIVTGGHNIHENPKTILQLRKILHEHLRKHNNQNTQ